MRSFGSLRVHARRGASFPVLVVVMLGFVLLAAPGGASAQMLREFEGELQKVSDKKILVDNKKGDKISFTRIETSEVMGEREAWDDLKRGDWVAVHSKMLEKPRKAYKVEVKPSPDDE